MVISSRGGHLLVLGWDWDGWIGLHWSTTAVTEIASRAWFCYPVDEAGWDRCEHRVCNSILCCSCTGQWMEAASRTQLRGGYSGRPAPALQHMCDRHPCYLLSAINVDSHCSIGEALQWTDLVPAYECWLIPTRPVR